MPTERARTSWPGFVGLILLAGAVLAGGAAILWLTWNGLAGPRSEGSAPLSGLAPPPPPPPPSSPGPARPAAAQFPTAQASPSRDTPVLATAVQVAADDFVVDIFLNGQRVPDSARRMTSEVHGAMGERVNVTVREGDWLVFNVVNNRLRWGGVRYFAAAGLAGDGSIVFVSEESAQWSVCESPGDVPRFIAERDFGSDRPVQRIGDPWPGGDKMMAREVPGWSGQGIWGAPSHRNIWLKFIAPGGR
jgi:hypothetical protein